MADRIRRHPSSRSARENSRGAQSGMQRGTPRGTQSEVRDELRELRRRGRTGSAGNADHLRGAASRSGGSTTQRQRTMLNAPRSGRSAAERMAGASRQGSVFFILGVIVLLIALLNITLVLRSYAQNVGQLNAVKNQEAELIQQKADLENDIQRWSDDAYVTAQARQRLGFIYPGERSVLVQNAPKDAQPDATRSRSTVTEQKLPWYTELLYSIENTDQAEKVGSEAQQNAGPTTSTTPQQSSEQSGQQNQQGQSRQQE